MDFELRHCVGCGVSTPRFHSRRNGSQQHEADPTA